jgi:hypothetical protein
VPFQAEVSLIRAFDRSIVPGLLMTLTENHLDDFATFWKARLITSEDEDQYWDWEAKKNTYLTSGIGIYEGYAVECEQITQGLMLLQTGGYRSQIEPDRRLVYVHSLATAPWNRVSAPELSGFRAVGRTLLKFAQFRSEELGYGGLVGLHSLPSAEAFYHKMGMLDGGKDNSKDDLNYFEWYSRRPDWYENL